MSWSGNLSAGASATITYSVTVRDPDPGDRSLTNTVTSASPGNNCPCTVSVTTLVPRLTVTTATDVSSTTPTGVVRYTVTATNTGQTSYPAANFTLALAGDATYANDATATSGNLTLNPDGTITWTGPLAPGQSVTATASVTVGDPASGTLTSNVTSTTAGLNCVSCTTSVPILQPSLTLTKTAELAGHHTRRHGHLHDHRRQHRPDPLPGRDLHRLTVGRARRRRLQRRRLGHLRLGRLQRARADVDGRPRGGAAVTMTYTVTVKNPDPGDRLM